MDVIEFQEKAVENLLSNFKRLWGQPGSQLPIVFKAPTGSGKTYMTEKFICSIVEQPDWSQDIAFIWITFSDDLAMQSRDKFIEYFGSNLPGQLLTINDFNLGALSKNSVMFLNWQKLVSQKASGRVNRRPDDGSPRKEAGNYFEDVIELTRQEGRKIILVIDESHRNVTEQAYHDVIDPINPKIIIKVSATPSSVPSVDDVTDGKAGYVRVNRADVVAAGMIKAELRCQTEDDLKLYEGKDLDETLLQLAIDKREELKERIDATGKDINPLVIIQLPNDDRESVESGEQTKEDYVLKYLTSQGVPLNRIAKWFSGEAKPIGLELNNSPYDYLLFKMAAGTGWDCPRAQVLVMFREIHSTTFETQTIGRIVRIPCREDSCKEIFNTGYIYTNYKRAEVATAKYAEEGNKPKLYASDNKKGGNFELDPKLLSEYMPRVDYGDLGKSWEFQQCLISTFNQYFGIEKTDLFYVLNQKLEAKGVSLSTELKQEIIINAKFKDYDQISLELNNSENIEYEVSRNDIQKIFSAYCVQLLKEQTDEDCKVGNIARSWSSLKSSLRLWLKFVLPNLDDDERYRIFIKDVNGDANSVFRKCVTLALKAYHPNLSKQIEERRKAAEAQECSVFEIKKTIAFSDDYSAVDVNKCIYSPFYLRKEYDGRNNELKFIEYIDKLESVDWWMKNGDSGKDWLSIRYFNSETGKKELFYPDWIIRFKDGTIGIFDTKGGITAASTETKCKAEELYKRVLYLNGFNRETIRYIGGIIIMANNQWYINSSSTYNYKSGSTEGWSLFHDVVKELK